MSLLARNFYLQMIGATPNGVKICPVAEVEVDALLTATHIKVKI
jgi:hypothetical protein